MRETNVPLEDGEGFRKIYSKILAYTGLYCILNGSERQRVENRRMLERSQPTPVLLPDKSHERRSLVGCTPWGH